MKPATFRIIQFPKLNKFIGLAWNYDEVVLVSTTAQESYTAARMQLQQDCEIVGVELRWFDGEYILDNNSGQLVQTNLNRSGVIVPDDWSRPLPVIDRLSN